MYVESRMYLLLGLIVTLLFPEITSQDQHMYILGCYYFKGRGIIWDPILFLQVHLYIFTFVLFFSFTRYYYFSSSAVKLDFVDLVASCTGT